MSGVNLKCQYNFKYKLLLLINQASKKDLLWSSSQSKIYLRKIRIAFLMYGLILRKYGNYWLGRRGNKASVYIIYGRISPLICNKGA